MTREEAKDLTLSILVIVAALLIADNVWLHVKCSNQTDRLTEQAVELVRLKGCLKSQSAEFSRLDGRLELHLNPPPEPTMADRVREAYARTRDAVKRGYNSMKESLSE